jgi:subtilisin
MSEKPENSGRDGIDRRSVVEGVAAGALGAVGLAGTAGAATGRHIVSATSGSAVRAARSAADSVYRVIDLGEQGTLVAGTFPGEALDRLDGRGDVAYVQPDRVLETNGQVLPWGIDRVKANDVHDAGETGAGAHLAIIDTGIDPSHEDLAANLGEGKAFTTCGLFCEEPWGDDHDHGTHVAGTAGAIDNARGVVGVTTEPTLHALKVCDSTGFCSTSDIADALRYTGDKHASGDWDPAVANLSLGSSSESPALKDAGAYAVDKGVLLVAAAGNDGPCSDCVGYPAAYEEYVAVSATNIDDDLAGFSSTGPEVELAAPGEDVCSSVRNDDYDTFSGTSMASPHVTGAGGHLVASGYSNTEARQRLRDTAEDIGLGSNEQGHGLVDVAAALGYDGVGGTGDGTECPGGGGLL